MSYEFKVEDVEYVRHDDTPQLARLYRPQGRGPFPIMVELHGGAWCRQDRLADKVIHESLAKADPSRLLMPPPRSAINVGIGPTPSATRSRPVNTPSTPSMPSAGFASMDITSAWACGERTNAACTCAGVLQSSA